MFAIAFDLDRNLADEFHPARNRGAYRDIERALKAQGFARIQGSTYAADLEDQTRLYLALAALHRLEWLGRCLKNVRVFRMESGADFTPILQSSLR